MIYHKSVSAGNDFLHVDLEEYRRFFGAAPDISLERLAERMCRRHEGAGADGVVYYRCRDDYTEFRIFNRDGTEAELSGNGMAGLSALLCMLGKTENTIVIKTKTGIKRHQLLERAGTLFRLRIEIGVPDFSDSTFFPFVSDQTQSLRQYDHGGISFYPVSVGNPHVVVPMENNDAIDDIDELNRRGELLEQAHIFPQKTNVEFVTPVTEGRCRVFYYERGVGRTLSSSTGSAAVFAVLRKLNRIDADLIIQTDVGEIKIHGKEGIYIENSTKIVYKGIWLV